MNALREQKWVSGSMLSQAIQIGKRQKRGNIGSYNDFGLIGVTMALSLMEISHLVLTHPEDGRMPPRTSEGQLKADAAPKFAWPERDGAWWLRRAISPMMDRQTLAVRCIYHQPATIP